MTAQLNPQSRDTALSDGAAAVAAVQDYAAAALDALRARVAPDGKPDPALMEREQRASHGVAWIFSYATALAQLQDWAEHADEAGVFGVAEQAIHAIGFAEYLAQLQGGLPLSQNEFLRPSDLGLGEAALTLSNVPAVARLSAEGSKPSMRAGLVERLVENPFIDPLYPDEMLGMMADQFTRLSDEKIAPFAHQWHLDDILIPMPLIEELAEMGVFGITVSEDYGGLGLDKQAMCVVTECLSRGYLGVGSLGTRAEIAGELIETGGTPDQKQRFLPGLASGEILSTAVFTEPDIGSDLAHLKTRAVRDGDVYRVYGQKTWITQGVRADLMTLLVRTDPDKPDHRGCSMFLAEKPRGSEADLFPVEGLTGGEIRTLGYRGMKEYDLSFDGFEIPAKNLLGGVEGQGFQQLMATFEGARVQTAARAVGVARNAFDLGLSYAIDRKQFGKPLAAFPRISDKLAMMAVEIVLARQLTMYAARMKDAGRRSDVEAGMAKLLAARVAWTNADNALQIHGGIGYALETPISRVLLDARILNIFEGTGEIQAHIIARGLLSGRN